VTATVATHCEQPVRDARAVNASATGVLIVFQGPVVPFRPGDRCLVSLALAEGALHVLGRVRRRDPGADQGQYVGIEFDDRLGGADLAHVTQEAAESRSG
jgi:PilZ domain